MDPWILIVDDDGGTREALGDILGRAGYRVAASDGGVGLEALLSGRSYRAAVLDYHLPAATGLAVARRLKELHPRCRVLMVSAQMPPEARAAAAAGAVDALLAKPFSKDALLAEVARLLAAGEP
jgi:CheY-like chemotaxis protein